MNSWHQLLNTKYFLFFFQPFNPHAAVVIYSIAEARLIGKVANRRTKVELAGRPSSALAWGAMLLGA